MANEIMVVIFVVRRLKVQCIHGWMNRSEIKSKRKQINRLKKYFNEENEDQNENY
jgi:hypothetical protein